MRTGPAVIVNRKEPELNKNYLAAINEIIKMAETKKINQQNAFDVQITSL